MDSAFLMKISNGQTPPAYATVAGLRVKSMELEKGRMSIVGTGIFTDGEKERAIRAHAFSGTIADLELSFDGGQRDRGQFLITRLDYDGDYNGERSYTIALESVGEVTSL